MPLYGRAIMGQRVFSFQSGQRYKRTNIISGLCDGKILGSYCYDWSTNSEWFELWLEKHLCPEVQVGSILILDNARFHRKVQVEAIALKFGLEVLWLPPYSPDKNKIENLWGSLKNFIRRFRDKFRSLVEVVEFYFETY